MNFMQKRLFLKWTLLFVSILLVQNSFSQDTPQWHLPEGVKARIGKGRANDSALSPDGTQLAVATGMGIWLYNVRTGAEIVLLTGHTDRVNSVAYSPNGKALASASFREIRLWDPRTQRHKTTFEYTGIGSLTYSPNSRILAVGRWQGIDLLNAQNGDRKLSLSGHIGSVSLLAFSSDGKTLASTARDNRDKAVRLWNARTGKLLRTLEHPEGISAMTLSPDGSALVSGSWDRMVRFWNTRTGRNTKTLDMWSDTLTYSPDGSKIAVGTREIRLLNARTGKIQQTLSGHTNGVYRMVFSSYGSTLVSASHDGTIGLWNVSTGSHRLTIEGHFNFRAVALSPNGKTVASTSEDGIFFWNTSNGRFSKTFDVGKQSNAIAYSPNGNTLAIETWSRGPQILLLNVRTGSVKKTLRYQGESVRFIVFSRDSKVLASGSWDGTIRLWNAGTGKLLRTLTGHTREISAMMFSRDGKVLASGSWDGTIRLWNAHTGKLLRTISTNREGRRSIAFSPDGRTLASGSWDEIWLLNAQNGELKQILNGRGEFLAYSRDGKTLASGGWRRIHLWNGHTGEPQRTLTGPPEGVPWLAFDPKGNTLVSRGWDQTILLWDMKALPKIVAEDVNLDGIVDVEDLITVASSFGKSVTKGAYPNPDINGDGVVNRQDVLRVITLLEAAASAPVSASHSSQVLTAESLRYWIDRAKYLNNTDTIFQKGIQELEVLLATLITEIQVPPAETALLVNYPNPFNPETWIPYHLANASDVEITIFDARGSVVRTLTLGHRTAGYYTVRSRAAYWDGTNEVGESVASGVYFYVLTAGDFSATRKMLILK